MLYFYCSNGLIELSFIFNFLLARVVLFHRCFSRICFFHLADGLIYLPLYFLQVFSVLVCVDQFWSICNVFHVLLSFRFVDLYWFSLEIWNLKWVFFCFLCFDVSLAYWAFTRHFYRPLIQVEGRNLIFTLAFLHQELVIKWKLIGVAFFDFLQHIYCDDLIVKDIV